MKTRLTTLHRLAGLAAVLAASALAVAQDSPGGKPKEKGKQAPDAAAAAAMPLPTPSPETKKLAFLLGQFSSDEEFFPNPMNPQPMKSKGTFTGKMALGGFFVQTEVKSDAMGGFQGLNLVKYDDEKKQYVAHWFDSFGTSIEYTNGQWKNEKTFVFDCEIRMMGTPMHVRLSYVLNSATELTFEEEVDFKDGKGFIPTMKIRLTKTAN